MGLDVIVVSFVDLTPWLVVAVSCWLRRVWVLCVLVCFGCLGWFCWLLDSWFWWLLALRRPWF